MDQESESSASRFLTWSPHPVFFQTFARIRTRGKHVGKESCLRLMRAEHRIGKNRHLEEKSLVFELWNKVDRNEIRYFCGNSK